MKKVLYSALYGGSLPFTSWAQRCEVVNDPSELTELNSALVIWGGSDISPDLYNHPHSHTTWPSKGRDGPEWALLHGAIERGIPIIGVCRGAQMLCAAAGGFLIQDVDGHHGSHLIECYDGKVYKVNSIHHQMMAGYEEVDHEMLAWTQAPRSIGKYVYKDDQEYTPPEGFVEAECIDFTSIKGFAIQWHPEMMQPTHSATLFLHTEFMGRYNDK
jgi:putative glutamine amidotransferase